MLGGVQRPFLTVWWSNNQTVIVINDQKCQWADTTVIDPLILDCHLSFTIFLIVGFIESQIHSHYELYGDQFRISYNHERLQFLGLLLYEWTFL